MSMDNKSLKYKKVTGAVIMMFTRLWMSWQAQEK